MKYFILCFTVALFVFSGTPLVHAQTVYHQGDTGPQIVDIQQRLIHFGLYTGEADGNFGPKTVDSVKAFQRSRSLTPNGIVDRETYGALIGRGTETSRGYSRPDVRQIIGYGMKFLGVPFVFGGESPHGFDCSGYVQYVFAKYAIRLPRTADMQFTLGRRVPRKDLQPGDLVYFSTYAPGASHVGIYIGGDMFLNAQSSKGIAVASLSNSYWASRYLGAKRILS